MGTRRKGVPPHVAAQRAQSQRSPPAVPSAAEQYSNPQLRQKAPEGCTGACRRAGVAADRPPRPQESNYWAKGYSHCQQCRSYLQGHTYRCPCNPAHYVRGKKAADAQAARSAEMSGKGRVGGTKQEATVRHGKKKHRKTSHVLGW